jgi:hypothetical protein
MLAAIFEAALEIVAFVLPLDPERQDEKGGDRRQECRSGRDDGGAPLSS